jgi:ABC-type uncharacterized transport system permease subunit
MLPHWLQLCIFLWIKISITTSSWWYTTPCRSSISAHWLQLCIFLCQYTRTTTPSWWYTTPCSSSMLPHLITALYSSCVWMFVSQHRNDDIRHGVVIVFCRIGYSSAYCCVSIHAPQHRHDDMRHLVGLVFPHWLQLCIFLCSHVRITVLVCFRIDYILVWVYTRTTTS